MASGDFAPEAARGEVEAEHDKADLDVMEDTEEQILNTLSLYQDKPNKLRVKYSEIMNRLSAEGVLTKEEKLALWAAMLGDKPNAESTSDLVKQFFSRIENEKKHEVRTAEAKELAGDVQYAEESQNVQAPGAQLPAPQAKPKGIDDLVNSVQDIFNAISQAAKRGKKPPEKARKSQFSTADQDQLDSFANDLGFAIAEALKEENPNYAPLQQAITGSKLLKQKLKTQVQRVSIASGKTALGQGGFTTLRVAGTKARGAAPPKWTKRFEQLRKKAKEKKSKKMI